MHSKRQSVPLQSRGPRFRSRHWIVAAAVAVTALSGMPWLLRSVATAEAQADGVETLRRRTPALLSTEQVSRLVSVRLQRMQRRRATRMARQLEDDQSFGAFERRYWGTEPAPPRTPPRPSRERRQ